MIRTAHDRGLRVVADLIVNHTSDKHPWFKESRRGVDNPYRDYYVWRDTDPGDTSAEVVFPGDEESIWAFDERTGQWYLHHFYAYQPDLNLANPTVMDELLRTIGFWLELGIDGFRMDGVPFIRQSTADSPGPTQVVDAHAVLKEVRTFLGRRKGDAMLLGEVNVPHAEQRRFFGGDAGDELHMMFDFLSMQATYLSLAREDPRPLVKALTTRPRIHPNCQWATFLRNHDELTLDKLTDAERAEVFAAFGPEPEMQVYNRGLKRRLPTMLDGDPRRIRMAYSLLFSLPGTPTIYYGEEIGMGEDLAAPGRMAVRTPMQWTAEPGAGFSTARASRLIQRVTPDGYGPEHVNLADQEHDPDSLFSFMRALISIRRKRQELGWGEFSVVDQPAPSVLAHRVALADSAVVAVHNLSRYPATVSLTGVLRSDDQVEDLLEGETLTHDGELELSLAGYGFQWLWVRSVRSPG